MRLTPLPVGDDRATRSPRVEAQRSRRRSIRRRSASSSATCAREGLAASRGATDFGEYFVYFSFFLVVSALVLVVLFFKLGVEQRVREVGLLRAVGLVAARRSAGCSLPKGCMLAVAGSLLGVPARSAMPRS